MTNLKEKTVDELKIIAYDLTAQIQSLEPLVARLEATKQNLLIVNCELAGRIKTPGKSKQSKAKRGKNRR